MPKRNSRKPPLKDQIFAVTACVANPQGSGGGNHNPAESPAATMSEPEKELLTMILPEEAPLPYPLHPLKMAYGPDSLEYEIPLEKKAEVLKALYPFVSCPEMTEERFDIHEQKNFFVKDFRVIRERNRNMLVSPYFPTSGGMLIDWAPAEQDDSAQSLPHDDAIPTTHTP